MGCVGNGYFGDGISFAGNRGGRLCQRDAGGVSFGVSQCVYQTNFNFSNFAGDNFNFRAFYFCNQRFDGYASRLDCSRIPCSKFLVGAYFQYHFIINYFLGFEKAGERRRIIL